MKYLLAAVALVATACVVSAGDRTECYVDGSGNVRCRVVRDSVPASTPAPEGSFVWSKSESVASDAGCTNCGCAAGQAYAMTDGHRRVLFPRAHRFVSTVVTGVRVRLVNWAGRIPVLRFRR